jgi:hypothetical protein
MPRVVGDGKGSGAATKFLPQRRLLSGIHDRATLMMLAIASNGCGAVKSLIMRAIGQ